MQLGSLSHLTPGEGAEKTGPEIEDLDSDRSLDQLLRCFFNRERK